MLKMFKRCDGKGLKNIEIARIRENEGKVLNSENTRWMNEYGVYWC